MGNSLGGRRTTKIMKLDGETIKLKTPVRVSDVLKSYPDHVLMDSDAVRHMGVRAKPLQAEQELKPKRLYFLVQLPALPDPKTPRRVRSGVINMSAKERLESLMLSRRSMSDLSFMKGASSEPAEVPGSDSGGPVRLKMRLPKAQVAKLMEESRDSGEAAEKLMELCVAYNEEGVGSENEGLLLQNRQWKPCLRSIDESCKPRQKLGVRFQPIEGGLV